MNKTTLTYLILVAVAVAVVVVEVKASEKRVRGGLTSGGGGEVDPNLRFGCTDPHALNWDPRANAFGTGEVIDSFTENVGVGESICQYFPDTSTIDSAVDESYRAGMDVVLDVYNRRDVCWSPNDPDKVVTRYMSQVDPKAINPITACLEGEFFIGAIEAGDILAAPAGTFMDSPHSARDQFGRSLYRPQNGEFYDYELFFDYLTEQHDPTKAKAIQTTLYPTIAAIDAHAVQSISYFNDDIMRQRVENLRSGDFVTSDQVYGRPFMVGDPRLGTFADFDLDKNGVITSIGPFGTPMNELGLSSFFMNLGQANQWFQSELMQSVDLDRDGMISFWEASLSKGWGNYFYRYFTTGMGAANTTPVWSKEDLGVLSYDGVACSSEDYESTYSDPERADVLCFPFNDRDLALMEQAKEDFDDDVPWWAVLDAESGQAWADLQRCAVSTGDILRCSETQPNGLHALGLMLNSLSGTGASQVDGSPVATPLPNTFFHNALGTFGSNQVFMNNPPSVPQTYDTAWDGVASKSCPSSHPNFIRFCHTTQTLPNKVGETIEIIENDTTTDV